MIGKRKKTNAHRQIFILVGILVVFPSTSLVKPLSGKSRSYVEISSGIGSPLITFLPDVRMPLVFSLVFTSGGMRAEDMLVNRNLGFHQSFDGWC